MEKEKLVEYLEGDNIKNINLINFIKNYPIHQVKQKGDSILVKGRSDQEWVYINGENEVDLEILYDDARNEEKYFVIQDDFMLKLIKSKSEIDWVLTCRKLYFPNEMILPDYECDIQELKPEEAEYIYQHYEYRQFTSVDYICDRIKNGTGIGIYDGNKLVAFVITQDDGAIGFLTVLPEYRRRGYAYLLTLEMIKRLREKKELPFVHIEEENNKSMGLAMKSGFVRSCQIHWVKLK